MKYNSLYQNSFVVALVSFFILLAIFFVFDIAPTITVDDNGDIKRTVNWKYPLIIAIFILLLWYFVVFPPDSITQPSAPEVKPLPRVYGKEMRMSLMA